MLASKHADPEAAVAAAAPANSRRKRSRADDISAPSRSSQPRQQPPTGSPRPSPQRNTPAKDEQIGSAVLANAPPPAQAATASALEPVIDPGASREAISPLPHVAELAQKETLPEATIIPTSTPSPKKPASRATAAEQGIKTPMTLLRTASQAPIAQTPSPELLQRIGTPRGPYVKKVKSRKGKTVSILLPSDPTKQYSGLPTPMTQAQAQSRVQHFEDQGYDTRGYGLERQHERLNAEVNRLSAEHSQGRSIFPDPEEQLQQHLQKRSAKKFDISVPDKKDWDDYVDYLREEKLRKLGVSMGDQTIAPSLSRQASSPYPPLAFSPPPPGSSAASQHYRHDMMPFSAPFSPAAFTNDTSMSPLATPPAYAQQMRPGHMSRQSTFNFQFPGQQPASLPQAWGPQRAFTPEAFQRGSTPLAFQGAQKPLPRLHSGSGQTDERSTSALKLEVEASPAQHEEQQSARQRSSASGPSEKQMAEIVSPKPQGHRHNISENLEREAESEQYYPGEYVNEQDEADKVSGPGQLDWSRLGASRKSAVESQSQKPKHQPMPSQTSNASSQLNVAAKEFKFEPGNSQNRNFSFPDNALLTSAPNKSAAAAEATSSVSFATAHSKQGSVSLSNLDVAAPEFKPPSQNRFAFSSNWFNFSAKKPQEPAATSTPEKPSLQGEQKAPTPSSGAKIFDGLSEIIKPGKKSKAVPIINPDLIGLAQTRDNSDGEQEDEDGRIERSDERRKRGRRQANDGDEIPRFAEPTPEPEAYAKPPVEATGPAQEQPQSDVQDTEAQAQSEISHEELQRHMQEDLAVPSRRPLRLEYELDVNGDLSDGSNVPWHGIDGDQTEQPKAEATSRHVDSLLAASPPTSSDMEEGEIEEDRSSATIEDFKPVLPYPTNDRPEEDALFRPTFNGATEMLEYINNDNSDFGIDDKQVDEGQAPRLMHDSGRVSAGAQHDLLSPSPNQFQRKLSHGLMDGPRGRRGDIAASPSPVRRLNKLAEAPVSDWDDMLSSGQELNIPKQHHLSDAHMAGLVEGLLRRHLAPFEKTLKDLGKSLNKTEARASSRFSRQSRALSSREKSSSDADEESEADEQPRQRKAEVKSERRMSQIRSAVQEAMTSAQANGLGQIEQETRFRKAAEQRADDLQRLLTITEKEIALYKESASNQDEKIKSLEEEREGAFEHNRDVEEELRTKTLNFTSEIAKLENDLDEYRASSASWMKQLDSVKDTREQLQRTIDTLRNEAADSSQERDRILEDSLSIEKELKAVTDRLHNDRAEWSHHNDKQSRDLDRLRVELQEAGDLKQKLGSEIERLSEREKEAIRLVVQLEETQKARDGLQAQVGRMNDKAIEHSTIVARYEREASEAHENTAVEVQRTRTLLETEVEIANRQVDNVKADLQTRLEMAQSQLENTRKDHDSVRERYERSLNEAMAARQEVLHEANNVHAKRMEEERRRFDERLRDLSDQHDRALRSAHQDKQQSETHLNSQLRLAEAQTAHLNDRISHFEERLTVAQSAAQAAAAAAAQASKASPSAMPVNEGSLASRTVATPAHLEKVSPQALRESIVVLQEQLHEREAQIERLEGQEGATAEEGTGKLREKEAEVGWLREILTVRIDDLTDLVNNLQLERFDRGAARNAAIRIKANLQMEQQERERQLDPTKKATTGPSIPRLSDIQNFASPKAAQLAAAWGSWRRNPPSLANMREAQNAGTPSRASSGTRPGSAQPKARELSSSANGAASFRPTNPMAAAAASNANKQPDSQSFLSGLMTPPASNLRRTPTSSAPAGPSGPNMARPRTPSRSVSRAGATSALSGSPEKRGKEPSTPELMRKGDYDLDAELGGQEIEEEADESPIKKQNKTEETADRTQLEPFGQVVAASRT